MDLTMDLAVPEVIAGIAIILVATPKEYPEELVILVQPLVMKHLPNLNLLTVLPVKICTGII